MYSTTRISVAVLSILLSLNSSASQCTSNQFQCKTGGCIPLSHLCDEEYDCDDGSDEGTFCHCEIGKIFRRTTKECLDKCQVLDLCSQTCQILDKKSHKCGCLPDFELNPDNKTCRGITAKPTWIYYTVAGTLWRMDPHTEESALKIQDNLIRSGALAADRNSVYWDSGLLWNQQIYGRKVDSKSAVQAKSLNTGGDIRELAVDWWTGNLYCTVDKVNRIVVIGNAPNKFRVLIWKDLRDPRAIALHPSSGRMFWSDQLDHHIGVAFMDGTGQRRLITTGIAYVRRLAVDQARERLYWSDHVLNKLESSTFEGQDRRVIMQQEKWGPQSLSILEDELVAGNYTHLFALGKFRGGNEREIKFSKADVQVWSAVHPLIQGRNYDLENPCNKYPCSYMCLLAGHGSRSCVCGEDNRLDDGTECGQLLDESDLLIAVRDTLYLVKFRDGEETSISELFPDTYSPRRPPNRFLGE